MNSEEKLNAKLIEIWKGRFEELRESIMSIAFQRIDSIEEYISLSQENERGYFRSLEFSNDEFEVVVMWDYYDGFRNVRFPQSLLYSDDALNELIDERKKQDAGKEKSERQREIAIRDALLEKYPLDEKQ